MKHLPRLVDMSDQTFFPSPVRYIEDRELGQNFNPALRLMKSRLFVADNLFRKDLFAHYGCVNAIEFSKEGELLVSGGDDRRVLLWNVEKAIHSSGKPAVMRGEHNSNIFCLGFDHCNSKIFSAGNDEQVIVHDIETGTTLHDFLHEEAVYGLSMDPLNDNVFASACDDGRVLIWDIREPSSTDPFCLASFSSAFHAVMYNPFEPRLLATANSKEGVGLWDVRQPKSWLMKYGGNQPIQSCMSVRFNGSGSQILALRRRLPPVLFNIHSPLHVCQFDHPGYYNSCTMKSCCFAGESDEFVLSGSDDFNLYMWKIPPSGSNKSWVNSAHMVLKGHRSIVNQVRFNSSNFLLASSGVEKVVKLWSPFLIPGSSGGLTKDSPTADKERKVYTHEEYISLVMRSGQAMTHDYSHQSMKEDSRMMAFFDSLVQREIEGLTSDSSLSGGNSDSWLFNVAESVSFSDVVQSSEDSSDDDLSASVSREVNDTLNAVSSSSGSGGGGGGSGSGGVQRSSSLTVVLDNAVGSQTSLSLDSSSHEDPDSTPDSSSRQKRDEDDSNPQGSLTESISWLISRKRQQLKEVARLKHQQTQTDRPKSKTDEAGHSRASTMRSCHSASESRDETADTCDNQAEILPVPGSSTSLSTASSSPSTPTSSCSLASLDEDEDEIEDDDDEPCSAKRDNEDVKSKQEDGECKNDQGKQCNTSRNHHKRRRRGIQLRGRGDHSCETSDRRKLFRKRRAHCAQDASNTDSDTDSDAACVGPHRKRTCANATDGDAKSSLEPRSIWHLGGSSLHEDSMANRLAEERHKADGSDSTSTVNGQFDDQVHNVVCVAVQQTKQLGQTEEHGGTSGSAASTPDSGIASQSFENGHPFNGRPSTSASDSSELMPPKFKRIRNQADHAATRKPRHYRSVSQDVSD